MIEAITLTNQTTGVSIPMAHDAIESHTYLIADDGLDFGKVSATHNTYTNVNQIGSTISSTNIGTRTVTITGYVHSIKLSKDYPQLSEDSYYAMCLEDIKILQETLSSVINPNDYIKIGVGKYSLIGKPDSSISFATEMKENNEVKCKFLISIYCAEPMFEEDAISTTVISGTAPAFHFPLILKSGGITMGVKKSYELVPVVNESDIEVGGIITIVANGVVENPVITDIYTQQKIKLNKTLALGEVIIIDTSKRTIYGQLSNGVKNKYYEYWDYESSWIQFPAGATLLGYSADDLTYVNMDISVAINQQFYSIGGQ